MRRRGVGIVLFLAVMLFGLWASADDGIGWRIDGGEPWQNRVGPGVQLAIGGNTCTDDFCDSTMDVKFFGSFGSTVGFFYRIIPNVVAFGDLHFGYIRTNYDGGLEKDRGFLFQFTLGGEFHAPITGWLDAYLGLGLGYALLRFKGETDAWGEQVLSYRGLNIELKIGADVYPLSSLPTFGVGLQFRYGFAAWIRACVKYEDDDEFYCSKPEVQEAEGMDNIAQDPFLIFFGIAARYGF
jgi:hypothetical protein